MSITLAKLKEIDRSKNKEDKPFRAGLKQIIATLDKHGVEQEHELKQEVQLALIKIILTASPEKISPLRGELLAVMVDCELDGALKVLDQLQKKPYFPLFQTEINKRITRLNHLNFAAFYLLSFLRKAQAPFIILQYNGPVFYFDLDQSVSHFLLYQTLLYDSRKFRFWPFDVNAPSETPKLIIFIDEILSKINPTDLLSFFSDEYLGWSIASVLFAYSQKKFLETLITYKEKLGDENILKIINFAISPNPYLHKLPKNTTGLINPNAPAPLEDTLLATGRPDSSILSELLHWPPHMEYRYTLGERGSWIVESSQHERQHSPNIDLLPQLLPLQALLEVHNKERANYLENAIREYPPAAIVALINELFDKNPTTRADFINLFFLINTLVSNEEMLDLIQKLDDALESGHLIETNVNELVNAIWLFKLDLSINWLILFLPSLLSSACEEACQGIINKLLATNSPSNMTIPITINNKQFNFAVPSDRLCNFIELVISKHNQHSHYATLCTYFVSGFLSHFDNVWIPPISAMPAGESLIKEFSYCIIAKVEANPGDPLFTYKINLINSLTKLSSSCKDLADSFMRIMSGTNSNKDAAPIPAPLQQHSFFTQRAPGPAQTPPSQTASQDPNNQEPDNTDEKGPSTT